MVHTWVTITSTIWGEIECFKAKNLNDAMNMGRALYAQRLSQMCCYEEYKKFSMVHINNELTYNNIPPVDKDMTRKEVNEHIQDKLGDFYTAIIKDPNNPEHAEFSVAIVQI